jgi:hypothetical protein|tara:strand:- start:149 stop:430 length:282 start_codon:yes stop_codon:yes gene_type:complete
MIPKSVRVFIDEIPENCARKCLWDSYHEYTQDGDKQFIGKINGRLEFMVQENFFKLKTIFMWDFEDEPKEWHNHFYFDDIPRFDSEVLEEVFV